MMIAYSSAIWIRRGLMRGVKILNIGLTDGKFTC